ncbi:hypothetical protein Enr13x_76630 [Stieleria neptunia]|uniref:Uncharacterized protein n=1 Tax=Stieleria neptunia TaxID=2527979 RepID=A0A518I3R5_9BACT|nr:hypothetical protein [Stieleria neptunia]QDV47751.1 hypothetical protein Enr13x_76630 [Stieleria neptunia]
MSRYAKWFFAVAVAVGTLNLGDAETATAGRGFRLFRGRALFAPRTYSPRQSASPRRTTSGSTRQWQPAANGPRIKGSHDWPGAIGNPPPNYKFFQDVNGYWR